MYKIFGTDKMFAVVLLLFCAAEVMTKINEEDDDINPDSSGDHDLIESIERIGANVAQVYSHPYAASLFKNNTNETYLCSAVILNTYWLLTLSKCFDPDTISSYVTHKNLEHFSIRIGSSYNNKGGSVYKIKMLINNFDLRISAVKIEGEMQVSSQVEAVNLPLPDDEPTYGYLASIMAWTPNGHMRTVNAPVLEPAICEINTKMLPGHYICLGGVQDPNRHFCRQDNGGAVIQNNTLIGITTFLNTCALYSRTHAFPKISSFVHWLHSTIWDENNRPSTTHAPIEKTTQANIMANTSNSTNAFDEGVNQPDLSRFMLTLPYEPINLPLQPNENGVLPGMSLYESYLQSMFRAKTTSMETTTIKATELPPKYIDRLNMYRRYPKKYGYSFV